MTKKQQLFTTITEILFVLAGTTFMMSVPMCLFGSAINNVELVTAGSVFGMSSALFAIIGAMTSFESL